MWLNTPLEECKLKAKEIIKKAMSADKITQKELAQALGLKSQQAIGNMLTRENGLLLESFLRTLDVMGYEVVVRKKLGESEEWKVDQ
jgi:transcriptional regulator with XRE-family HTH domain